MSVSSVSSNKKTGLKGLLLVLLLNFFAISPRFINRAIAYLIGKISCAVSIKMRAVITTNLKICLPELSSAELNKLVNRNLMENAKLALEFPFVWLAKESKITALIRQVNHQALADEFVKNQQPLIIAVPHLGNWELFWHWVQINYPAFGMYSPAKIIQVDKLILNSRQRFGGEAFGTDPKGIMLLMRRVKKGGVMMILTDQAPREGAGTYAPFFGQSAYTMTLLHRFIKKTGANLLFGSCLRHSSGDGFSINLYSPKFDIRVDSAEEFNFGMNQQIETMILKSPEQYQWSYKRFKRQPEGINLYKK